MVVDGQGVLQVLSVHVKGVFGLIGNYEHIVARVLQERQAGNKDID